jgi:hypothetical protein
MSIVRLAGGGRTAVFAVAALVWLVPASQAQQPQAVTPGPSAQGKPAVVDDKAPPVQRPYRGLFGAGSAAAPGSHQLDLTAEVYHEYGTTTDAEIPDASLVLSTGWFMGVRSGLGFQKSGRTVQFSLRGDGAFRYYRDSQQTTSPRYHAEMAIDARTGKRRQDSVKLSASFDYEPYYILSIFPSQAPTTEDVAILPPSRDDLLFRRNRSIVGQAFAFDHQLTPRSYFSLYEDTRTTHADTVAYDVTRIRAGARYGYRMTRYASLRFGYTFGTGRYGLDGTSRLDTHDIDLSLDYRRPLTRSRRTTVGFSSGSALVNAPPERRWTVVATGNLRHELGAGWFIQGDFGRNLQLVEGFGNPFFVNTASASLGGFMGRRVELLTTGGYSWGRMGFGSETYSAVQGAMRLRLALARFLSIDTGAYVMQNQFDTLAAAPGALPASMNRWAIRTNVSVWLPLAR